MKPNEQFNFSRVLRTTAACSILLTGPAMASDVSPTSNAKKIECEASNHVRTQKKNHDLGLFFLRAEIRTQKADAKSRAELTDLQTAYQDHAAIKAGASKEWTPQMKAVSLGSTRTEPNLTRFRAHIFGPAGKLTTLLIPTDAIQQSPTAGFVALNNIEAGDEAHGGPFTIHQKFHCRFY